MGRSNGGEFASQHQLGIGAARHLGEGTRGTHDGGLVGLAGRLLQMEIQAFALVGGLLGLLSLTGCLDGVEVGLHLLDLDEDVSRGLSSGVRGGERGSASGVLNGG